MFLTPGVIPTHRCRLSPKKGCFFQGMLPVIHWTDLHSVCRKRLQIDLNILENTREVCLSTGSGSKLTRKVNFDQLPVDRQTSRTRPFFRGRSRRLCVGIALGGYVAKLPTTLHENLLKFRHLQVERCTHGGKESKNGEQLERVYLNIYPFYLKTNFSGIFQLTWINLQPQETNGMYRSGSCARALERHDPFLGGGAVAYVWGSH
eukprot:sb/3470460/